MFPKSVTQYAIYNLVYVFGPSIGAVAGGFTTQYTTQRPPTFSTLEQGLAAEEGAYSQVHLSILCR
jgi:hypothetical protein